MTTTTEIQCLCGAVKLELSGVAVAHFYCHCDDCQRGHGAAYLPAAMYRTPQTRLVAGQPALWALKTTTRATCRDCGTRIFAEPRGLGVRSISATLAEVADLMLRHGAHEAIQLDGGGSATLVRSSAPGHVQHVNSASNFRMPWWERPVANHLGIIARPLGP